MRSPLPHAPLWLAWALAAAACFWTSNGVAHWQSDPGNAWHHYEYLTEGFAHGHTYLSLAPEAALLKLKDPFDPDANLNYRLWDASLYHGRYYLYYGPAPAATLMLPWRMATGRELPQRLATAAFAALGLLALALLLLETRRACFADASDWVLAATLLILFHASWLPVVLRRSAVWELPIVAAAAFLWWALLMLWKFHASRGQAVWAAATGLALALMMGSRVTSVFAAGVITLLLFAPVEAEATEKRSVRWRSAAVGALVAAAGGLALLAYNHIRFGSWLEFGQSFQLWGITEERHTQHFRLSYVPFNAWLYLFSLPQLSPYFPFTRAVWPDSLPGGYLSIEEMHGALLAIPAQLLGLAGLGWAFARRGQAAARPLCLVLAAASAASLIAAGILFCWAGACSRYILELWSGWTVVSGVGCLVLLPARRLALAAAFWTVAYVWLASADFRAFMRQTNPRVYAAAAHLLNYPSQWAAERQGIVFGPVDVKIQIPQEARSAAAAGGPNGTSSAPRRFVLIASGRPAMVNQLVIEFTDPRHVRLSLVENDFIIVSTADLPVDSGTVSARLEAPWLYPPAAHPYWDTYDPGMRLVLQTRFALTTSGGTAVRNSTYCFDSVRFEPVVRTRALAEAGAPWVEALEQLRMRP